MRKFSSIAFMVLCLAMVSCNEKPLLEKVNVFNGSSLHGHTYPGATTPYGLVQLSPDTRVAGWDASSGYYYADTVILGFSHTHLSGTGVPDLGDFLFTPGLDEAHPLEFSHKDEKAVPGYYKVRFNEGIVAELTATPHCGVHRYSFSGKGTPVLMVDARHCLGDSNNAEVAEISAVSSTVVIGHRLVNGWSEGRNIYISSVFSTPFTVSDSSEEGTMTLVFPAGTKEVTVYSGLSCKGIDEAKANRDAETAGKGFDAIRGEASAMWSNILGRIKVKGGPADLFYTCLYHTSLAPNVISDNGETRLLSTLSIWDTFRTWNPLQTILDPSLVSDIIDSMLKMYEDWGELPVWPLGYFDTHTMPGYHSVSIITDAWLRGIRTFDGEKALQAMVASSNMRDKNSSILYNDYGYVPADMKMESVSQTLEFAYDDWCIARMAESLGHEDIAAQYDERALRYRNLFDPMTGFMRGRYSDGNWTSPFDPLASTGEYTESIPWQVRFFVPHDLAGQTDLMGGREVMLATMDSLFTYDEHSEEVTIADISGLIGQYAHGNEPSHNTAFLFNWLGNPSRSQEIVRRILEEMYSIGPEGICGNEDCGQMSAWYVLSSLGMFPACPGSGQYILSAPLFEEAEISLGNGNTLLVKADNPEHKYISSVTLNGKEVERNYLTYEEIMGGGELCFVLSSTPDHGRDDLPAPYSLSTKPVVSMPYVVEDLNLFMDSSPVHLVCRTEDAAIHYTIDGSEPTEGSPVYTAPFNVDRTLRIRAKAFKDGCVASPEMSMLALKTVYREPSSPEGVLPGCRYSYHRGTFGMTSDVIDSPAVERGTMKEPSIMDAIDEDHFGYIFTGLIDIPSDGIWGFSLKSDDGAILEIDGTLVVNNDGSHSAMTSSGRIPLKEGLHSYRLVYLEDYEDQHLSWSWKAEDESRFSPIPPEKLFYR